MNQLARVEAGRLLIEVSAETLRFAAEHCPELWNGEAASADGPYLKITDAEAFMLAVCGALNAEDEDGSTPATRILDAAILSAVEDGCDGIDHDWEQSRDADSAEAPK